MSGIPPLPLLLIGSVAALVASYLLGSFPAGYFAGKVARVDIRKQGSGNLGATNVLRVLGKRYGYAVFFLDAFKGFVAVRVALYIAGRIGFPQQYIEYLGIAGALFCVIGHTFPVWLRFKGGKGVATSAGSIFGLMPVAAITIFLIWVLVFEVSRYVSVASVIAAVALPITVYVLLQFKFVEGSGLLYFAIGMTLLVVWSHRSNFARLAAGTEQRFERK